jgi:hypothetical protein
MTTINAAPTYTLASSSNASDHPRSSRTKSGREHKSSSKSNSSSSSSKQHHSHSHRRNHSDPDPLDGNGSLTYSAASSVHSGGSAAGESTDSSFADIMRVLDLQDTGELKAIIKKEGVHSVEELREKRGYRTHQSGVSVASSLNYSIDGDSHLDGSQLLQTIAG